MEYFFFIGEKKVRVCKPFYLGTLDISHQKVAQVYKNITSGEEVNRKPEENKRKRNHISSFPKVESHYCRSTSKREYLSPLLSIKKMYELYVVDCEKNDKVKESMYRSTFCNEFNLHFHVPKKDRCDFCEEVKAAEKNSVPLPPEKTLAYESHVVEKQQMRIVRNAHRAATNQLVISFDLQNVINLPHAEISSFFYKRKLTLYNLTAHVSIGKKGYCAIWIEMMAGREGNDIASAFIKIISQVVQDYPSYNDFIAWSDSCVPQNRNSVISYAIMAFMSKHEHLSSVTIHYSIPGHSAVQEVDNMHSNIEKAMRVSEFFSPVSFLRILLKVHSVNPYKVMQMNSDDFMDYYTCAKSFQFSNIHYRQVHILKFTRSKSVVQYKKSFLDDNFVEAIIIKKTRMSGSTAPKVKRAKKSELSAEKKADLRSMMKFMPLQDQVYYEHLGC